MNKSKLKLGRYYRLSHPMTEEVTLGYFYLNPDAKCAGFGFNTADGGGFVGIDDLLTDTVLQLVDIVEVHPLED